MFPPVREPLPSWRLNVVLSELMKDPFDPVHKADLKYLYWKTALLLALKLVSRLSELQAFTIKQPFM